MACYNPIPVMTGKGQKIEFLDKWANNKEEQRKYLINEKYHLTGQWDDKSKKQFNLIPCNKCLGCKIDKAKDWAVRSQLEAKMYDHNYFITLTYNNENLPTKNGIPTLQPKDLTRFIKSLRKHFERKNHIGIKYLAGCEYGEERGRPHYHIIFFNLPLEDIKPNGRKNEINQPYYSSKLIDKLWGKATRTCDIGKVTYESASYTTRYSFKKIHASKTKELGIEPEQLRMSNGIGKKWLEQEKNYNSLWELNHVIIKNNKGVINAPLPKYFKRKMEEWEPEKYQKFKKKNQQQGIEKQQEKIIQSKISNWDQLKMKEQIITEKINLMLKEKRKHKLSKKN